jgi:hypothetical protein
MSTALREAAQQALEALENSRVFVTTREKIKHPEGTEWYDERITALRAVLAQQDEPKGGGNLPPPLQAEPVEEPVAWIHKLHYLLGHAENMPSADRALALGWEPLYTHPPRREWQSLSEEETRRLSIDCYDGLLTDPLILFARAIEQALKEKNA